MEQHTLEKLRGDLSDLKDEARRGKSGLQKEEMEDYFQRLNKLLSLLTDEDTPCDETCFYETTEILSILFEAGLSKYAAAFIEQDTFKRLGSRLLMVPFETKEAVSCWLDIFRYPEFLGKIYDDRSWDALIAGLIRKADFRVADLFEQRLQRYEKKTLFNVIKGDQVKRFTWDYAADRMEKYAAGLIKFIRQNDLPDDTKVAFFMENSLQFALLDLACLTTGIVNVMIPANAVEQHLQYILEETEAGIVIVSGEIQLAKVKSVKNSLTKLKSAVIAEGASSEEWVVSLTDITSELSEDDYGEIEKIRQAHSIDDPATIMFTSGTTGEPKGIVFSYMNIVYKRYCRAMALPELGEDDRYLAYLPLFHTFGRWLELMGAVFWAAEYSFMENPSLNTMLFNMKLIQPTVFISIPKKWIQLYEQIISGVDPEIAPVDEIRREVAKATGGSLMHGLSAAGFLPPDVFRFFQKYGVELMSGFGMTEATGGITMTPPGEYEENSLGKALPGIELKLAGDGELLIRGDYVMKGYFGYNDEDVFDSDGWLPTGDIMKMDGKGFIEIIDRKKEIYKNIRGETIAPQKIENYFRDFEVLKQVFLVGDHRPHNTLLIYPDYDMENSPLRKFDEQNRHEFFSSIVVSVNKFLPAYERILDFRIIDRPFSEEQGELTPKGTYKRKEIEKNFSDIIESMYSRDHHRVSIGGVEVRIPNWFMREMGTLSSDLSVINNTLSLSKVRKVLTIEKRGEQTYRIGDYIYRIRKPFIDLQYFLINPVYWTGNQEFFDFTGGNLIMWYRNYKADSGIGFEAAAKKRIIEEETKATLLNQLASGERSIFGLHLAVMMMQSIEESDISAALDYFDFLLQDDTLSIYQYTRKILSRVQLTDQLWVKRKLFATLAGRVRGEDFSELFKQHLGGRGELLSDEVIGAIIEKGDQSIIDAAESELKSITEKPVTKLDGTAIPQLFKLLAGYGIRHPKSYQHLRQVFVSFQIMKEKYELVQLAREERRKLREGFRDWLGPNQQVAIDVETGEEYTWEDVLTFEEQIDIEDKQRIRSAVSKTNVLCEAIFLFSNGKLINLNNILRGGVWVSHIRNYHDKSVYRVSVQTRMQGAYDIVLHLNKKRSAGDVREEVNWLIMAGARYVIEEFIEDFGGYWQEYDLWSSKYVPGDTVEKFFRRKTRKKDPLTVEMVHNIWPFFVWNAAAAYSNFWRLTGHTMVLADSTPANFIIPVHDYQMGTKIVSFSSRAPYENIYQFTKHFYEKFILPVETKYPSLKRKKILHFFFSGIIDAEGKDEGKRHLIELRTMLQERKEEADSIPGIEEMLDLFLAILESHGFMPKTLLFSTQRFHRWYKLNREASINAQAEMLQELYETYRLEALERFYPATRTRFFFETIFRDSNESISNALLKIIKRQRNRDITPEELLDRFAAIQTENELNEREQFFLTRLSFPHLKPSDSAVFVNMKSDEHREANLIVEYEDYDGNPFYIRKPVSPKEISRLHQLFIETNLLVTFRPEHQFLVALSDRDYIIGGLFYQRMDEEIVHMEKIVVSNRYRRKGISQSLMNEFFNRLRSEHIQYVTTGFFRPEFFYHFGFTIESKYSGLVKDLRAQPPDRDFSGLK